jgi:geranylgeranyl diphosphate synthase type II
MVGGQAIDLQYSGIGDQGSGNQGSGIRDRGIANRASGAEQLAPLDADGLRRMHGKKTGALIRAAAAAGAMMGGGTPGQVAAIDEAATEFGLAFQIVDDVLDVEGASADLGKTAGKDAAAGKVTYPALYGLAQSRQMAADCLSRAEAALRRMALHDSQLMAIGRWIIERKN